MPKTSPWRSGVRIIAIRDDGLILGALGYDGGPAVAIRWCADLDELTRRAQRALAGSRFAVDSKKSSRRA
jgi:hypothetical protein